MDGLRVCNNCGYHEDAGTYPDWPNGLCEDCDPKGVAEAREEAERKSYINQSYT